MALAALSRERIFLLCAVFCRLGIAGDIHGKVIDNGSGDGVPAAIVQLAFNGSIISEAETQTRGEFTFQGVADGQYAITAERPGYLDPFAGATPPATVAVSGRGAAPVELRLVRACSISGRVQDSAGAPAPEMKVLALARRFSGGTVRLIPQGLPVFPDDRGAYRLHGLSPGTYTVAAVPEGEQTGHVPFAAVYLPGVEEETEAEFLTMRPGEDRDGVDLTFTAASGSGVGGRIAGIPPDWGKQAAAVSIFDQSGRPVETVYADAKGHFFLGLVPPGSYQLVAWGPIFGWGSQGPAASGESVRQGSRHVEVGGTDLVDVEIELRGLGTLGGRANIEGEYAGPSACYAGAEALLRPLEAMPSSIVLKARPASGTFAVADVPAGRFKVDVRGLVGGCYLKEVHLGGRKTDGRIVNIDGDADLTLTFGVARGTVSGTVIGPDGKPPGAGCAVILVGVGDGDASLEGVRRVQTDEEGNFRAEQMPPGPYEAMAVRGMSSNDYMDPVYWEGHGAVRLTVADGKAAGVTLRFAP